MNSQPYIPPHRRPADKTYDNAFRHNTITDLVHSVYSSHFVSLNGVLHLSDVFVGHVEVLSFSRVDPSVHSAFKTFQYFSIFWNDYRAASLSLHLSEEAKTELSENFIKLLIHERAQESGDHDLTELVDKLKNQNSMIWFMRSQAEVDTNELHQLYHETDHDILGYCLDNEISVDDLIVAKRKVSKISDQESRIKFLRAAVRILPTMTNMHMLMIMKNITPQQYDMLSSSLMMFTRPPDISRKVNHSIHYIYEHYPVKDYGLLMDDEYDSLIDDKCYTLMLALSKLKDDHHSAGSLFEKTKNTYDNYMRELSINKLKIKREKQRNNGTSSTEDEIEYRYSHIKEISKGKIEARPSPLREPESLDADNGEEEDSNANQTPEEKELRSSKFLSSVSKLIVESSLWKHLSILGLGQSFTGEGGVFRMSPTDTLCNALMTLLQVNKKKSWVHVHSLLHMLRPTENEYRFFGHRMFELCSTLLRQAENEGDEDFISDILPILTTLKWSMLSSKDTWSQFLKLKGCVGEYLLCRQEGVKYVREADKLTFFEILLLRHEREYCSQACFTEHQNLKPDSFKWHEDGTLEIIEFGWCYNEEWKRQLDTEKWDFLKATNLNSRLTIRVLQSKSPPAFSEGLSKLFRNTLQINSHIKSKYPKEPEYVTLIESTIYGFRARRSKGVTFPREQILFDEVCERVKNHSKRMSVVMDRIQGTSSKGLTDGQMEDIYETIKKQSEDCQEIRKINIDDVENMKNKINDGIEHKPRYDTMSKIPIPSEKGDIGDTLRLKTEFSVIRQLLEKRGISLITKGKFSQLQKDLRTFEIHLLCQAFPQMKYYVDFNYTLVDLELVTKSKSFSKDRFKKFKSAFHIQDFEDGSSLYKVISSYHNLIEETDLNKEILELITLDACKESIEYVINLEDNTNSDDLLLTALRSITFNDDLDEHDVHNPMWDPTIRGTVFKDMRKGIKRLDALRDFFMTEIDETSPMYEPGDETNETLLSYQSILSSWAEQWDGNVACTASIEFIQEMLKVLDKKAIWRFALFLQSVGKTADSMICRSVFKSDSRYGISKVSGYDVWLLMKKHDKMNQNYKCCFLNAYSEVETTVYGKDWNENRSRPFFVNTRQIESCLAYPGKIMAIIERICAQTSLSPKEVVTNNTFHPFTTLFILSLKDSMVLDELLSTRRYLQHAALSDLFFPTLIDKVPDSVPHFLERYCFDELMEFTMELMGYQYKRDRMKDQKDHNSLRNIRIPQMFFKEHCSFETTVETNYFFYIFNKQHGNLVEHKIEKAINKSVEIEIKLDKIDKQGLKEELGFADLSQEKEQPIKGVNRYSYQFCYSAARYGASMNSSTITQTVDAMKRDYNEVLPQMKNNSITIDTSEASIDFNEWKKKMDLGKKIKQARLEESIFGRSKTHVNKDTIADLKQELGYEGETFDKTTSENYLINDMYLKTNQAKSSFCSLYQTSKKRRLDSRSRLSFYDFREELGSRSLRARANVLHKAVLNLLELIPSLSKQVVGKSVTKQDFQAQVRSSQLVIKDIIDNYGKELFWIYLLDCDYQEVPFLNDLLYTLETPIFDERLSVNILSFLLGFGDITTGIMMDILITKAWTNWMDSWEATVQRHHREMRPLKLIKKNVQIHRTIRYSRALERLSETMLIDERRDLPYVAMKLLKNKIMTDETVFKYLIMAKVQHAGDRDIYTGDLTSKLILRLTERIFGGIGKGIKNECVDVLLQSGSEKKFFDEVRSIYDTAKSNYLNNIWTGFECILGTEDCAKWGPNHDPITFLMAFLAVQDEIGCFEQSEFEFMVMAMMCYVTSRNILIPDTVISKIAGFKTDPSDESVRFLKEQLEKGQTYWSKGFKDMLQGIHHAASSAYCGLVKCLVNSWTKRLCSEVTGGKLQLDIHDATSSDDSGLCFMIHSETILESEFNELAKDTLKQCLKFRHLSKRYLNMETSPKTTYDRFFVEFKSEWLFGPDSGATNMSPLIKFALAPTNMNKELTPEQHYCGAFSAAQEFASCGGSQVGCNLIFLEKIARSDHIFGKQQEKSEHSVRYSINSPIFCGGIPLPSLPCLFLLNPQEMQNRFCNRGKMKRCLVSDEFKLSGGRFVIPLSRLELQKRKNIMNTTSRDPDLNIRGTFKKNYDLLKSRYMRPLDHQQNLWNFEMSKTKTSTLAQILPKDPLSWYHKSKQLGKSKLWIREASLSNDHESSQDEKVYYHQMIDDIMMVDDETTGNYANKVEIEYLEGIVTEGPEQKHELKYEVITQPMSNEIEQIQNPSALVAAIALNLLATNAAQEGMVEGSTKLKIPENLINKVATGSDPDSYADERLWEHFDAETIDHSMMKHDVLVFLQMIVKNTNEGSETTWDHVYDMTFTIINSLAAHRRKTKFYMCKRSERLTPLALLEYSLPCLIKPGIRMHRTMENSGWHSNIPELTETNHYLSGIDLFLRTLPDPNCDAAKIIIRQYLLTPGEDQVSPLSKLIRFENENPTNNRTKRVRALKYFVGLKSILDSGRTSEYHTFGQRLIGNKSIYEIRISGQSISVIFDRSSGSCKINTSTDQSELLTGGLNIIFNSLYPEDRRPNYDDLFKTTCGRNIIYYDGNEFVSESNKYPVRYNYHPGFRNSANERIKIHGHSVVYQDGYIVTSVTGLSRNIQNVDFLIDTLNQAGLNEDSELLTTLTKEFKENTPEIVFHKRVPLAIKYNKSSQIVFERLVSIYQHSIGPLNIHDQMDIELLEEPMDVETLNKAKRLYTAFQKTQELDNLYLYCITENFMNKQIQRWIKLMYERKGQTKKRLTGMLITELPGTIESFREVCTSWEQGASVENYYDAIWIMTATENFWMKFFEQRYRPLSKMSPLVKKFVMRFDSERIEFSTRAEKRIAVERNPIRNELKFFVYLETSKFHTGILINPLDTAERSIKKSIKFDASEDTLIFKPGWLKVGTITEENLRYLISRKYLTLRYKRENPVKYHVGDDLKAIFSTMDPSVKYDFINFEYHNPILNPISPRPSRSPSSSDTNSD